MLNSIAKGFSVKDSMTADMYLFEETISYFTQYVKENTRKFSSMKIQIVGHWVVDWKILGRSIHTISLVLFYSIS